MPPLHQQESPRRNAGLISQLLFIWLLPLFQKGFRKTLQLSDIWKVLPSDESRILGDELEKAWNKELEKSAISRQLFIGKEYKPSLLKALTSVFGPSFAAHGIFAFYEECILKIAQPICLGLLLRYFTKPEDYPSYTGPLLATALVGMSMIYTSSDHPFTFAVQHIGMKIRISLSSLIYRKALRMSRRALQETPPGQIANFLSSDMNRFDILMTFLHYFWVAPIQFVIVIMVMYQYLDIGWPCFTGIGFIVIFVPFQGLMGHLFSRLRRETADKTDKRLLLMDEILSSMRVIKMYAWEEIFTESVGEARRGEVIALRKTAYCKALNQSLFYVTSRITLFLTLLAYVLLGNKLTSEIVFVTLALFNNVQNVMALYFPAAVVSLAESLIAVKRIESFLLLQEKPSLPGCYEDESPIPNIDDIKDKEASQHNILAVDGENKEQGKGEKFVDDGDQEGDGDDDGDDDDGESSILTIDTTIPRSKSKRLETVIEERTRESTTSQLFTKNVGVQVHNCSAQWDPYSRDMAFNNVSLKVKRGEILAVVGPVGAGKGSLVQAILGELPIASGELSVRGRVAYTSQDPWIFPGSVRDNILFGREFESDWYDEVVDACALTRDLTSLPYGDHTLVGDRGAALSGGQKARINLARAVYSNADIYLLDDPLSAVDPEVSSHLITYCILGLLKDKARILITHQLQYLASMSKILLLVDGYPKFYGGFKDLLNSGIPYTEILTRIRHENTHGTSTLSLIPSEAGGGSRLLGAGLISRGSHAGSHTNLHSNTGHQLHSRPSHHISTTSLMLENTGKNPLSPNYNNTDVTYTTKNNSAPSPHPISIVPLQTSNNLDVSNIAPRKQPPTLLEFDFNEASSGPRVEEEELASGNISWKVYWTYLSSGSSCSALFVLVFAAITTQIVFTATDFWLQFWIQVEEHGRNKTTNVDASLKKQIEGNRNLQIAIYSTLISILFVLALLRTMNFYRLCMQTSVELHQRLFIGILRSPMSFFENNPLGRIMNRFAKDIGVIDETLPSVSFDTIEIFLQSLGVVAVVSSSSPYMLIPAGIVGICFYCVRKFYFQTGRAIKRLEGVARSPVFAHLNTSVYGLPTIRAFGVQAMFQKEFESYLDVHSSVWYLFLATSRWLGIVVDWLATLFVTAVLINCLVDNQGDAVTGLALTSAMMLTSMLQWGIRQSAELSSQLISVERVLEYCNLKSEAAMESEPEFRPSREWPDKGEIRIQNLSLKYSSDSPVIVLKNINCIIYGGEKIGVVGRTGAGKSSLLSALFRIVEPSEGFIEIDGVMTNSIGLHDLRSRLTIIPQDPVLFQGSIRKNLDPFHRFPDANIWAVLKDVNLEETVQEMSLGIYSLIVEGGANFSMGQKQLFCLARAILRSNQILLLDEATANIDPETDALIQKTLRVSFAACTVITIAHRLHTVMDCDRIIVLDDGKIVEMDEPYVLLLNKTSALSQLVKQAGKEEAAKLIHTAKMAAAARRRAASEAERQQSM